MEVDTELFYAIIPTLFSCFLTVLLSLHLVTFLLFMSWNHVMCITLRTSLEHFMRLLESCKKGLDWCTTPS